MKKLLPVFLLLALLLSGCSSGKDINCETVLIKALAYTGGLSRENGRIFLLSAEEGSAEYFSDENKAILYGKKALEYSFEKIEDCAIFVSSSFPEEIAVFKCYSSSDTGEIASFCLSRADDIKVALRGTEWSAKAGRIRVSIYRRFVFFVFTEDPGRIEEKLRELV